MILQKNNFHLNGYFQFVSHDIENYIFNRGLYKQETRGATFVFFSFPSLLSIFFLLLFSSSRSNLAYKRKKIVKCGERLFAHSYSSGVAQQCDWLTTLPYVLLDTLPFPFVSHCCCSQTLALNFFFSFFTQIREYTCIREIVLLLPRHLFFHLFVI